MVLIDNIHWYFLFRCKIMLNNKLGQNLKSLLREYRFKNCYIMLQTNIFCTVGEHSFESRIVVWCFSRQNNLVNQFMMFSHETHSNIEHQAVSIPLLFLSTSLSKLTRDSSLQIRRSKFLIFSYERWRKRKKNKLFFKFGLEVECHFVSNIRAQLLL